MTPRRAVVVGPDVVDRPGDHEPWRTHATSMATRLSAAGHVRDPQWRDAFARTPRHLLLPETDALALSDDAPEWWLEAAYCDEPHRGTDMRPAVAPSQPTPAVLAWLLTLLVSDDRPAESAVRVLEVGAGHGYVTALLCHRFGAEQVTATDAAGADHTRARLAALDLFPCLVTADGIRGASAYGPFDAILCATGRPAAISPEWLSQLADGGRIVAAVRGPDGRVAANLYERPAPGAGVRSRIVTRDHPGDGTDAS